jgi:hypothetical protein
MIHIAMCAENIASQDIWMQLGFMDYCDVIKAVLRGGGNGSYLGRVRG